MGDGRRVVFWTGAAGDSLDEILTFIALDSPALASKVAEVVLGAAESLSLFAERGRVVPEMETSTIRETSSIGVGSCTRLPARMFGF